MNISFYTAAVGADQQQQRLDIHGNNIANVNTYGFRAKKPSFTQLMTQEIPSTNDYMPRGVGSRVIQANTDFTSTALNGTERNLDYAIDGSGFFALEDPVTGEISFTRDGSFILSSMQVMEDVEVLDENGVATGETQQQEVTKWYLSDGMGRFVISDTGTRIEVENYSSEDLEMLPIGIYDFISYDGMESGGDNRFLPVEKNGELRVGSGTLVQGYVENSNVDLGYELTKVIECQRSFSYMLRMVTVSDEIESTVNSLR